MNVLRKACRLWQFRSAKLSCPTFVSGFWFCIAPSWCAHRNLCVHNAVVVHVAGKVAEFAEHNYIIALFSNVGKNYLASQRSTL